MENGPVHCPGWRPSSTTASSSSAPASPASGWRSSCAKPGSHDFVVLEKAGDLGGTWRDNTYPGCRCDVPSHLYSFSFEPNPDWSHTFSPQPEIWDYMRRCVRKYGVASAHPLRPRGAVRRVGRRAPAVAARDLAGDRSRRTSSWPAWAACIVPSFPICPGIDRFEGQAFHSAEWDHDHDLDRQARRRDRHRRVGDPVRPADPAQGRAAARLPAHPAVGHAAARPPDHAPRARASTAGRAPPSSRCARRSTGRARRSRSASSHPRYQDEARPAASRGSTSRRRSPTPSCAAS